MIAMQHTGDPNTGSRALQVEHEVGAVAALAISNGVAHAAQSVG
jgi:hypothetical protein